MVPRPNGEDWKAFADQKGLLTQAWTAFGIDAAVWFAGAQGAVMLAIDAPEAFAQLMNVIAQTDYARTELAAATDGVDMVCPRRLVIRRPTFGRPACSTRMFIRILPN